jgi:hypothetical protein
MTFLQAYFAEWMIPTAATGTTAAPAYFGMGSAVIVVISVLAILALATVAHRAQPTTK